MVHALVKMYSVQLCTNITNRKYIEHYLFKYIYLQISNYIWWVNIQNDEFVGVSDLLSVFLCPVLSSVYLAYVLEDTIHV